MEGKAHSVYVNNGRLLRFDGTGKTERSISGRGFPAQPGFCDEAKGYTVALAFIVFVSGLNHADLGASASDRARHGRQGRPGVE
jgi:hypothetical protein